jgi:hypothetical protein
LLLLLLMPLQVALDVQGHSFLFQQATGSVNLATYSPRTGCRVLGCSGRGSRRWWRTRRVVLGARRGRPVRPHSGWSDDLTTVWYGWAICFRCQQASTVYLVRDYYGEDMQE